MEISRFIVTDGDYRWDKDQYEIAANPTVYLSLDTARQARDQLNDEFNGFIVVDDELVHARPWKVYELVERE